MSQVEKKTNIIDGPKVGKLHALSYVGEMWSEINPGEEQGPIGPRYKQASTTMKVENINPWTLISLTGVQWDRGRVGCWSILQRCIW